jgi:hypothetical protein
VAGAAHGSPRVTVDLDVVYARAQANFDRLTAALRDELEMFGFRCRCLDLERLIEVKRAAGRPKELEAIAELEAIREERRQRGL